eukprot:618760_1
MFALLSCYIFGVIATNSATNPCSRYSAKTHISHPKLECSSPCFRLEIPAICYHQTYQDPKTNEYYQVYRYRHKENNLRGGERELNCGNSYRRRKHTQPAYRYRCAHTHVEKIKEERDNYCSDRNYKCIKTARGKYRWECYFKFGEWLKDKAPIVEKGGHKVTGEAHWKTDDDRFDMQTLRYTFDADQCEPNQIKHITGDDIKTPLIERVRKTIGLGRKAAAAAAYREYDDWLLREYEEEEEILEEEEERIFSFLKQ